MEESAFQWWNSFDPLTGDLISNPNPTKTLSKLKIVFDHLTSDKIGWRSSNIHLFGFGQGGSCISEFILYWNQIKRLEQKNNKIVDCDKEEDNFSQDFGSLVTVSGPLLSLPTISSESFSKTPVLLWIRKNQDCMNRWITSFKKGFKFVEQFIASNNQGGQESMPKGHQEWDPIMR